MQDIESHRQTDDALQQVKRVVDQASQAKSRCISAICHELRTIASGHDGLDLLAAGYRSDVLFVDLAMAGMAAGKHCAACVNPGMPAFTWQSSRSTSLTRGWTTTWAYARRTSSSTELIDWLERTLGQVWCHDDPAANPAPVLAMYALQVWLDARQLASLLDVVQLGFYRGILDKLAGIETQQPATEAFVEEVRVLARQFRFEAMASLLTQTTAI